LRWQAGLGINVGEREQVFHMLNMQLREGKNSPMVCKFLGRVSALGHNIGYPEGFLISLSK
jgi:hypothetical protein